MNGPLSIGLTLIVSILLLAWFTNAERKERATSVIFILGLLVVETTLYGNQSQVPTGLLHPGTQPLTFRLVDAVIAVALIARLIARGLPRRLGAGPMLWIAFLMLLAGAGIVGAFEGNSIDLVTFEGKAVLYLGVFAVAAGVPARRLFEDRGLTRLLYVSAGIAAVLCFTDLTGARFNVFIPGIGSARLGGIDGDTATILVSLGFMALVLGACREKGRLGMLLASGPLLITPFLSLQRAAMVTLAVGLFTVVMLVPQGWKRLRTTPTEVALATLVIVGVFMSATLLNAAAQGKSPQVPLASKLSVALYSPGKQLSAQDRLNQLGAVGPLLAEKPLLGWGLGKTYVYWEPGYQRFILVDITHNVLTDVILRMGIVGLVFLLAATTMSLRDGMRAWMRHPNDLAAALALAGTAIVTGLLAKGLVESIFEKYRIATLLGLTLGMIRVLATSAAEEAEEIPETALHRYFYRAAKASS
jgi:O-antigen ligase/polysaccharide polymerase Wzy-like membrane protein